MISRGPTLTEQVRRHIKQRIAEHDFADGRIPPEADLADELGVSRTTVRDALSRLEHEGVVIRRQGSGTFVNEHGLQIHSRVDEVWSYEALLEAHGYTPAVSVLGVTTEDADLADVAALGVAPNSPMVMVEKLFLEGAVPVVLTENRLAAERATGLDDAAAAVPIYEFLARSGTNLAYYLSELVPVAVDDHIATKLEIAPGTAVLRFDETGYDQESAAVVRATSWFRDDLVRFRLIRKQTGT